MQVETNRSVLQPYASLVRHNPRPSPSLRVLTASSAEQASAICFSYIGNSLLMLFDPLPLTIAQTTGFFVDENGEICSVAQASSGCYP